MKCNVSKWIWKPHLKYIDGQIEMDVAQVTTNSRIQERQWKILGIEDKWS